VNGAENLNKVKQRFYIIYLNIAKPLVGDCNNRQFWYKIPHWQIVFFHASLVVLIILYYVQGSTVEREASQEERDKVSPTLKDVDFINIGASLYIDENDRTKLMSTLASDAEVRT